jgi:hypothetical protein
MTVALVLFALLVVASVLLVTLSLCVSASRGDEALHASRRRQPI